MSARVKIALAISLILNIFLLGLGIGLAVTGARITPATQGVRRQPPPIWAAAESLPPDERAKFRQMLRERAAAVQPQLRSVRQARRQAGVLMAQPAYDAKAVADTLRQAREGEMQARTEMDTAFVDYLTHLTPQQRAAVGGAMARSRPNALQRLEGQGRGSETAAP